MTTRSARVLLLGAGLGVALIAGGSAAFGASSPDGAVQELVERIESGGFEDLSGVTCPEFEESVRAEFDPAAIDPAFGEPAVEVEDPAITLVSEEEATAIVNLTATLRVTFDEERLREVVRAQLEAGGQAASEEDVELMLGALAVSEVPIDEDLTVVERSGEWLICAPGGGFSDAGMCGLVTPDEIAALAPVPIQSNVGSDENCQWIGATASDYFSVDVGLIRDANLDDYRSDDPNASDISVGDRPALASSGRLFVEVDGGVLSVVPDLQDAPSAQAVDPIAFASSVAELFLPRLGQLPASGDAADGGSLGAGADLLADCGAIPLEDLSAVGPLVYDDVSGSDGYCVYASNAPEVGEHFVSISVDPSSTVDDQRGIFGGGTDREVAGRDAYAALDTLWVQLDGATLSVAPVFADSPAAEGLDPYDYAADVAELVIGILEADA